MSKVLDAIASIERSEIAWACLTYIFAIAFAVGLAVIADDSGASSSTTGAFAAVSVEPVPVSPLSGINPLANGETK